MLRYLPLLLCFALSGCAEPEQAAPQAEATPPELTIEQATLAIVQMGYGADRVPHLTMDSDEVQTAVVVRFPSGNYSVNGNTVDLKEKRFWSRYEGRGHAIDSRGVFTYKRQRWVAVVTESSIGCWKE